MTDRPVKKYYSRFSAAQRLEHMVILLAFFGLVLTGFPQKYSSTELARTAIQLLGGMESLRIMHRSFAVILMVEILYHSLTVSYNLYVKGDPASLIPRRRDWQDARDWIRFNLRLKAERPKMSYFNFGQKWDYWVVVIGLSIMTLSGIMMWNPIAVTNILPGQLIPAARVIHTRQAFVLVAGIFVWHWYSAWFKHYNLSILTGKISHSRMERQHGALLENPTPHPERSAAEIAQKRQKYMPIALITSLVLIGGAYLFLTYEETAIDTVPRQSALIYAPNFEITEGNPDVGAAVWKTERCAYCHGDDAQSPLADTTPTVFGTELSFEVFYQQVRTGKNEMPGFSREEIPDRYVLHMYSWLINDKPLKETDVSETESSSETTENNALFG